MSMRDAMKAHDDAMMPVLAAVDAAIDTALRSGAVDTESLMETINSHVDWWVDEIAASEGTL